MQIEDLAAQQIAKKQKQAEQNRRTVLDAFGPGDGDFIDYGRSIGDKPRLVALEIYGRTPQLANHEPLTRT